MSSKLVDKLLQKLKMPVWFHIKESTYFYPKSCENIGL